jgi:glucose/arabinose dehydrogenase
MIGIAVMIAALAACREAPSAKAADTPTGFENQSEPAVALVAGQTDSPLLRNISLPPGFRIEMYAENLPSARCLKLSPEGTLFVGSRSGDKVFAVRDSDADFVADERFEIGSELKQPVGVEWRDGNLYVAEISRVWRYDDIESRLGNPPKPVLIERYPSDEHHGWKFIRFGPDGRLHVPVGAPCNVCEKDDPIYASITSIKAEGGGRQILAQGIRNTVGFDWHPVTGELWFTDNGRDMLGDNIPPDELNRIPAGSGTDDAAPHFGFPYYHAGDIKDPDFSEGKGRDAYLAPMQKLGPHVAALGMRFYPGGMFPKEYTNQIFICEHGSWNRSNKIGYRIMLVRLDSAGKAVSYEPFATGWLSEREEVSGRPVAMEFLPDGSMLVSDDYANCVYRISYQGS